MIIGTREVIDNAVENHFVIQFTQINVGKETAKVFYTVLPAFDLCRIRVCY